MKDKWLVELSFSLIKYINNGITMTSFISRS